MCIRISFPLLAGLLLGLVSEGCPGPATTQGSAAGKTSSGGEGPRMHVGRILRLARAGVLEEEPSAGGRTTLVARVPGAGGARSWQLALDTQGNQFRVAPGGRIVPDGEPSPEREPASEANVAYYFAQTFALLEAGHKRDGLVMAAEILDLPARDPVVRMAQRHVCALLGRLSTGGKVEERLFHHLVAVSHREGTEVVVRNHVHGFSLVMPIGWKVLAGAVPPLGPLATGLVFALPRQSQRGETTRTNILWTTSPMPAGGEIAAWAAERRLATPGSRVSPLPVAAWPGPPGVSGALGFHVEPLEYQGRRIGSAQIFFRERGLGHHVSLLAPDGSALHAARPLFTALVGSFRQGSRPSPCASPTR